MILLLGATGYIGQAFAKELRRKGACFIPLSRGAFDYTRFDLLFDYVRRIKPELLINAAGYSGSPNVDACEVARMETFQANTLLPQTVARVCTLTNTPWGHVSSGAIYSGAKVFEEGEMRVERDLGDPEVQAFFARHKENFFGFTELDEPNFTFRSPPCNFLAGTRALAEEALRGNGRAYIWRPKLLFGEGDHPRNLLTKLQSYPRVLDHITSVSHVGEFARACLEMAERGAPFGTYNVANPGAVSIRQVVERIRRILKPSRRFHFWRGDDEFYSQGGKAPRSRSILDVTKLLRTGVKMRSAEQALEESLERWESAVGAGRLLSRRAEPILAY